MLVERAVVPEARLTAANASVARLDGIAGALVPLHHRAGLVGHRTLAAHLVEAISLSRVLIVKGLDKQPCIVIGPPIAGVMYAPAIEFLRPSLAIQCRNLPEHQQVSHHSHHYVGNWRAAGHVDHRLVYQLVNRRGSGRIRLWRLHASIRDRKSTRVYFRSLG